MAMTQQRPFGGQSRQLLSTPPLLNISTRVPLLYTEKNGSRRRFHNDNNGGIIHALPASNLSTFDKHKILSTSLAALEPLHHLG